MEFLANYFNKDQQTFFVYMQTFFAKKIICVSRAVSDKILQNEASSWLLNSTYGRIEKNHINANV